MNIQDFIEAIEEIVGEECNECDNIDGCRIRYRQFLRKFRFDGCLGRFYDIQGGCDCIIALNNKVVLVECKRGQFGSSDAKRASKQFEKCADFVKRIVGYHWKISAMLFSEKRKPMAMNKIHAEMKRLKIPIKFKNCGDYLE